jgi:hypothetical protein
MSERKDLREGSTEQAMDVVESGRSKGDEMDDGEDDASSEVSEGDDLKVLTQCLHVPFHHLIFGHPG